MRVRDYLSVFKKMRSLEDAGFVEVFPVNAYTGTVHLERDQMTECHAIVHSERNPSNIGAYLIFKRRMNSRGVNIKEEEKTEYGTNTWFITVSRENYPMGVDSSVRDSIEEAANEIGHMILENEARRLLGLLGYK